MLSNSSRPRCLQAGRISFASHYNTYEASLLEWEKKIQQLEAQGIRPIKVEVDVEELLTWCATQGLAVTPETRTKFMMNALRDYCSVNWQKDLY